MIGFVIAPKMLIFFELGAAVTETTVDAISEANGFSSEAVMKSELVSQCVRLYKYPVDVSSARSVTTVSQLKQSWTVAPAKARSNWALSEACPRLTRVEVRLVPMLAPMIMGMAVRTDKTGNKKNTFRF